MRRILSVLFVGCLMMISTLAPRVTFAVAPAPTPTAFTGGDASYEAMCAIAQIAVAAPISGGNECEEVSACRTISSTGTHFYYQYRFFFCRVSEQNPPVAYIETLCGYIAQGDSASKRDLDTFFENYEYRMENGCSPALPVCMLPPNGRKLYRITISMPGCPLDGQYAWVTGPDLIRTATAIPGEELMLESGIPDDTFKPFRIPTNFCTEAQIICTTAASPEDAVPCDI